MNSSERSHESVSDLNNSVDLNRRSGFRLITVEPVLFIASICNGMSIPLIQQYIYKRMQDEYDPDVVMSNTTCRHQHSNFTHVVEQHSSMWMMYLSVSLLVPTFFSSLVLGTCSDKLGRKVALLVPYIGSLARLLVVIVVIGFNLNVAFLFIGNIIDGMCGGAVLVIMSCYAYISDITTEQQRTFRIVILDCATMVGTIISSVGNGFLIQYTGFLWPHIAVVVLSAVNVFYIMSLQETIDKNTMAISSIGYFVEPLKVYVKYDNNGRRWKLAIIVVIMILSIMVDYGRSDSEALHLLSAPFCWSSILLGLYTATVQATRMVMSIMLTKVCMRWIGDLGLLFVACLSGAAYEFVFPLGKSNNGLFLGKIEIKLNNMCACYNVLLLLSSLYAIFIAISVNAIFVVNQFR